MQTVINNKHLVVYLYGGDDNEELTAIVVADPLEDVLCRALHARLHCVPAHVRGGDKSSRSTPRGSVSAVENSLGSLEERGLRRVKKDAPLRAAAFLSSYGISRQ